MSFKLITALVITAVMATGCASTQLAEIEKKNPEYKTQRLKQERFDDDQLGISGAQKSVAGDIAVESCMANPARKSAARRLALRKSAESSYSNRAFASPEAINDALAEICDGQVSNAQSAP